MDKGGWGWRVDKENAETQKTEKKRTESKEGWRSEHNVSEI